VLTTGGKLIAGRFSRMSLFGGRRSVSAMTDARLFEHANGGNGARPPAISGDFEKQPLF
jgi:hypothetical protein